MILQSKYFNDPHNLIRKTYSKQLADLHRVLTDLPTYLKESDQRGRQGTLIFDPGGTNREIQKELEKLGWSTHVTMPAELNCFGTDFDFFKDGALLEVQFSNYPFLSNNIARGDLVIKTQSRLPEIPAKLLIVITKSGSLPASNSTLYYEQAVGQLALLTSHKIISAPIHLIGLFPPNPGVSNIVFTKYSNPRYSRKVVSQTVRRCSTSTDRSAGPCVFTLDDATDP